MRPAASTPRPTVSATLYSLLSPIGRHLAVLAGLPLTPNLHLAKAAMANVPTLGKPLGEGGRGEKGKKKTVTVPQTIWTPALTFAAEWKYLKATNGHSALFCFVLMIYICFAAQCTTSDLPVGYKECPGLLKMLSLCLGELRVCWDGNCFNFDVPRSAHLFQLFRQTHSWIYHLCICSWVRTP